MEVGCQLHSSRRNSIIYLLLWMGLCCIFVDSAVVFTSLPDTVNLPETVSIGSDIYTLTPYNGTAPYDCSLEFQIPDNNTRNFRLNGSILQTSQSLDFEKITQYILTIECTDSLSDVVTSDLTVNIEDIIDEVPVISGPLNVDIYEEEPIGTPIKNWYNVTDADAGDVITYSLTGSDSAYFQIDSTSGTVSVKTRLDRDSVGARIVFDQLTLVVQDSMGFSATASLTITLEDINDNTPSFSPSVYYASVNENTASGMSVIDITCTDIDETPGNGDIAYSITSGDDILPKFQMSGTQLQTNSNSLDYEALSGQAYIYELVITATDGGNVPNNGTATIIIQVTPENDNPPIWDTFVPPFTAGQPYEVLENATIGTNILTAAALDLDDGIDGVITYSILSITDGSGGSQAGVFRIESVTGEIMNNVLLDTDPPTGVTDYTLLIEASDNGLTNTNSVTQTIQIQVVDCNDNPPVFSQSLYEVSVNEDEPILTSVFSLTATDNDLTSSSLTFFIDSGDIGSKFTIQSGNELQVQNVIDLDNPNNDKSFYSLVIRVTDGESPTLSGSTTVLVTILPTNDFDPVIQSVNQTVTIPEDATLGTDVLTVVAIDNDIGDHGENRFSITGGDSGNNFNVDLSSGQIKLVKVLDYESLSINPIELIVTATDGGGLMDSSTLTLSITDVNDNSPTCFTNVVYVSVPETISTGSNVYTLACYDPDTSDTLSYNMIQGNEENVFQLSTLGEISLLQGVDFENGSQSYTLVVSVSDGTEFSLVTVTVNIEPVNEHSPLFLPDQYNVTWPEDTPMATILVTYTATDLDSGTDGDITYSISSVSQSGSLKFNIDPNTGGVLLKQELDYESLAVNDKYYILEIKATDGGGLQGTGTVTIHVSDVNDNNPQCNPSFLSLSVAENTDTASLPLTVLGTLPCSDQDDGTLGTLAYSYTQVPSGAEFAVEGTTGEVTLTRPLDFESTDVYEISIQVADGGTPALSTAMYIRIQVTNVNDGPPVFVGVFETSLSETALVGQPVLDVTANDPDDSNTPEGKLSYSLVSGDPNNNFVIDPETGQIRLNKLLDAESVQLYSIIVKALEQGGTYSATTAVIVNVTGVNDNIPTCHSTVIVTSVSEDAAPNLPILAFSCTDDDGDSLSYSITSGDGVTFSITSTLLQVDQFLDYDAGVRSYRLVVKVSDGTNAEYIQLTVNVNPVNEGTPTFTNGGDYELEITEDETVGNSIFTAVAIDSDSPSTSHGIVSYSFVMTYPKFLIDGDSGVITLQSSLNREDVDAYELLVKATDGELSSTATINVNVTDVNDNQPIFGSISYSGSVSESDVGGASVIVKVSASDADDPDTFSNGLVSYSLASGNTGGYFTLDSSTGELKSTSSIDYDILSPPSFNLVVYAVDKGGATGALTSSVLVNVVITSENDNSPTFAPTVSYNVTLTEDVSLGYLVVSVTATDADKGDDGYITYSMSSHPKFHLDQSTGEVAVKHFLDYEVDMQYTFDITATDNGSPSRSSIVTVYVSVLDINDNFPDCSPSTQTVQLREDTPIGSSIANITCVDSDSGENAALSYSVHSVNSALGNGPFLFGGSNSLLLNSGLNYESTTSYAVVISVSDGGTPAFTATVFVSVLVSDVNEHDPVFSGLPYSVNVLEDTASGVSVIQIAATDLDQADILTFAMSPPSSEFGLDPTSGIISTIAPLDRESIDFYNLTVLASDSSAVDSKRTVSTSVLIQITDVNDNTPVFNPASYSFPLPENSTSGTTVITLTATDSDLGTFGEVTYSLVSGNTDNVFRVEKHVPSGECILMINDDSFLDYETIESYNLAVRATDGTGLSSEASVFIVISGFNEYSPIFTPSASSTVFVDEDTSLDSVVIDINATDSDNGDDGDLVFSIQSGSFSKFSIDPSSGVVLVSGFLDAENTALYNLVVTATDGGVHPSAKSSSYILTIRVQDVNDISPVCTREYYSGSIVENSPPSSSVITVQCNDGDISNPNNQLIYYVIGGSGTSLFDIDSSTGQINTNLGANIDREVADMYSLTVGVSDQGSPNISITVTVHIQISDVNDNDPFFCCSPYNVSIGEETPLDTSVLAISATDIDDTLYNTLSYSILSGNIGNKFMVDSITGEIRTAGQLDRETISSYNLTIVVTDVDARSGTAFVLLEITDYNDNIPMCKSSRYYTTVTEDVSPPVSILTLECPDADDGSNAVVAYSIISTGVPFTLGSSSGILSLSNAIDAEFKDSYLLDVNVTDGVLSSNLTISVTVIDVNEFPPVFIPAGPYTVTLLENETLSTVVMDLNATDIDISEASFLYDISTETPNNYFTIDTYTGEVKITNLLDFEKYPLHELTITVSDGTLTSTTTLSVSIGDINDNPPACNPEISFYSTLENHTGELLALTCDDVDIVSTELFYSIIDGNINGDILINNTTGVLSVSSTLDFEMTEFYDLEIEVSDGFYSSSAFIKLTILGVNEFNPVFTLGSYQVTVSEESSIGASLITVNATDSDSGIHGSLKYAIVAGNIENKFAIEELTGAVKVAGLLNREQISMYNLTIRAMDGQPGSVDRKSTDIALLVIVEDTNDNFPVFNPSSYYSKVYETTFPGKTLLFVSATDDDSELNGNLTFSISGGNSNGIFTMVENAILIAPSKSLNYESKTYHTLTILASDQGVPSRYAYASAVIQVLPVNEFAPVFASNDSTTIAEDTPVGKIILAVSAVDDDSGNDGRVVYSFSNGLSMFSPFYVNSLTGDVQVWSPLDYDTGPVQYTLEIVARDKEGNATGLSSTMTFSVEISDINDEIPVFSSNSYYFSLDENVAGLHSIGFVNATDLDSGANGNVTYVAISGDTNIFTVEERTGEVTTAQLASIDYELKKKYSLVIQAKDLGSPTRSSQCTVFITVSDLNDNAPLFQLTDFSLRVQENVSVPTLLTTLVAFDLDSGNNGVFTYLLFPTGSPFTLEAVSGELSIATALDFETTKSYTLLLTAVDKGEPPLTGTSTVTIIVEDVNDNPPVVIGTYDTSISEGVNKGAIVVAVVVNDADEGANSDVTYEIVSGNTNNDWKIEHETGILTIANALDRETTTEYHLVISVTDKGSPMLSSSVTISLTISDANDNAPIFSSSSYSLNVEENASVGSQVGRLTATDADIGANSAIQYQIVYFLVGSNVFTIDQSNGLITTTSKLDREGRDQYIFVCRAYDNGVPQLSSDVQVIVTVNDLNDHNPKFTSKSYEASVVENVGIGTPLCTVIFNDDDIGTYGTVTLSIDTTTQDGIRAEQLFSVDSNSGIISTKQILDRETDSTLIFTLIGEDGGNPPMNDTTSITISILDENDNAPIFITSFVNLEVAYDGTCGNYITTVTATDKDQGSNALVNYYIVQTGNNHLFSVAQISGDVSLKATAVANTKYLVYVMAQDKGTTTRTSANNLALRIDAFDPADMAISFSLSVSKAYFNTNQKSFVDNLTLIYITKYPSAVVKIFCVVERDGEATDPTSARRRLLANGDKPVTVHMYVLKDNQTEAVENVGVTKNFLSSSEALALVSDGSNPLPVIKGSSWEDYGIVTVEKYETTEEETPWISTTVGIAVVTSASILLFLIIVLAIIAAILCYRKRRKRPITPIRAVIGGSNDEVKIKNNSHPPRALDSLKSSIRPAVLALPMPERRKAVNNDVLVVNRPENPVLTRDYDGRAVDPVSGKLYEYNTRTKERRWLQSQDGKAVMAYNVADV